MTATTTNSDAIKTKIKTNHGNQDKAWCDRTYDHNHDHPDDCDNEDEDSREDKDTGSNDHGEGD